MGRNVQVHSTALAQVGDQKRQLVVAIVAVVVSIAPVFFSRLLHM